ncbi:hypothetical protein V6N12_059321 [Hibiscus sabdariffa]|uniref:Uncharacterized protein n=1 Tax=Hibiscus sabdariffa TaxID=183260 RepID=A0ABR2EUR0_9ROSI
MQQIKSAQKLADYLAHFRADSIVDDAEFIRVCLVPEAKPWTVLGQEGYLQLEMDVLQILFIELVLNRLFIRMKNTFWQNPKEAG